MRTTKKQALFILSFVYLLMVVSIPFSLAAERDELMCETGDYIPLSLYEVWGSSPVDVFFVALTENLNRSYSAERFYTRLKK